MKKELKCFFTAVIMILFVLSSLTAVATDRYLNEKQYLVSKINDTILKCKDNRSSFFKRDLYGVSFVDDKIGTVVGDEGTILHTIDGGNSWSWQTSYHGKTLGVPSERLYDVSFFNEDVGMAIGLGGTVVYTNNSGDIWETAQTGHNIALYGAHMVTQKLGFAAGVNTIFQPIVYRTTDCWQTWDIVIFYLEHGGSSHEGDLTDICFTNTSTGFVSALVWNGDGAVVKTVDCGETWETIYWINNYRLRSIDFPSSDVGYVAGDHGIICKTSDGGDNWELVYSNYEITVLNDVSFPTLEIGTAVGSAGCILRTEDGGDNWESQNSGVNSALNAVYFVDPDIGYVVGNDGVILKTTDGGDTWNQLKLNVDNSQLDIQSKNTQQSTKFYRFVKEFTKTLGDILINYLI